MDSDLEIFQQRMRGGARQSGGSQQEPDDLTGGLDGQDPNDWDDVQCMAACNLNFPVAITCSSDSDDGGENMPADDAC